MLKYRTVKSKTCSEIQDPKQPDSFNLLGVIQRKRKRYEEAVNAYEQGLEVDPKNYKIYHNLALALSALDRYDEARIASLKAQKLKSASKK